MSEIGMVTIGISDGPQRMQEQDDDADHQGDRLENRHEHVADRPVDEHRRVVADARDHPLRASTD